MVDKRSITIADNDGNILPGAKTFLVSWGELRATVNADDHEDAACRTILYLAIKEELAPPHMFIRIKPKGKGNRDPRQDLFFPKESVYKKASEKYGLKVNKIYLN